METSALDGGNVETAFQNILAGNIQLINILHVLDRNIKFFFFFFFLECLEIYRVVSNKALESESGRNAASGPGAGKSITVAPTTTNKPAAGKCC